MKHQSINAVDAEGVLIKLGRAKIQCTKAVPIVPQAGRPYARGTIAEPDGELSAEVVMELDIARLLREYADKAVKNKRGQSRALNGCIKFTIIKGSELRTGAK